MSETTTSLSTLTAPLPWQTVQWAHLMRLRAERRLPHAILLRGPTGTGKALLAAGLGQTLLCASPDANGVACGACKPCHLVLAGTHPDWQTIEPEEGARQIKVDQIRELVEFATKKAQMDGYRVVVIRPAEAMNINAANALLKSLEEPGADTVMILVSHQSSGLPATIRSRCQSLDMPMPNFAESLAWLGSQGVPEEQSQRLLAVAGGAPITAFGLRNDSWPGERDTLCKEYLAVLEGKAEVSQVASRWSKLPIAEVVRCLLAWHIDLHRILANTPEHVLNRDLIAVLQAMATRLRLSPELEAFYPYLQQALYKATGTANPNPQLLLEAILIRWQRLA